MTPKEQAKDLIERFSDYARRSDKVDIANAQKCALIGCDIALEAIYAIDVLTFVDKQSNNATVYYTAVKDEIRKL